MFTYPFTRDLILTSPRRRTLERRFVNSYLRCTFLPRNTYQIVHSVKTMQCIYWDHLMLTPCVWPLIPRKVVAFRKRKTSLMAGYHCTDFWRAFYELWLLNEHRTICFLSYVSNNCIIRNKQKNWKNLTSCYFQGITLTQTLCFCLRNNIE